MFLIGHTYGHFTSDSCDRTKTAARCQAILVSVADLFVTYDERFTGLPPRVSSDLHILTYFSTIPNMTPTASDLRILPRDPLDPEALFLLREAAIEARRLYADLIDPAAPMPTNDPPQPGSIYLIAFFAENPVGCGALRKIDKITAEVRRMYVLSSARRAGIGRALLSRLEMEADKLGFN
jgi:GNAT superfamily N-acetyltransferase